VKRKHSDILNNQKLAKRLKTQEPKTPSNNYLPPIAHPVKPPPQAPGSLKIVTKAKLTPAARKRSPTSAAERPGKKARVSQLHPSIENVPKHTQLFQQINHLIHIIKAKNIPCRLKTILPTKLEKFICSVKTDN
jgi:hypothetical protein